MGTGTRPPWGPHHAWGWQCLRRGSWRARSCPQAPGPAFALRWGRASRAVGPSAWAGDPCTGEWASPGRLGPQQQPHGADGVTRKGRIRGTCPELPPAPWMGSRWHPGTLGRLVWRAAGALGAPGSAPRGVGAASQPSPGHTSPAAPGSPSGHALSAHALAPSAPVARRTPGTPVQPAAWTQGPSAGAWGFGLLCESNEQAGAWSPCALVGFSKIGCFCVVCHACGPERWAGLPHLGPNSLTHAPHSAPASPGARAHANAQCVFFSPQPVPFGRHLPG